MFQMRVEKGLHAPVFTCAVCNSRIEKANGGIVLYGLEDAKDVAPDQIVVHSKCFRSVDGRYLYSHDLDTLLIWVEQNVGFNENMRKQAEFKAEMLSRF